VLQLLKDKNDMGTRHGKASFGEIIAYITYLYIYMYIYIVIIITIVIIIVVTIIILMFSSILLLSPSSSSAHFLYFYSFYLQGILLLQDLAVVPLLVVVDLLGRGGSGLGKALAVAGVKALVTLSAMSIMGRKFLNPIFSQVRDIS
jgi:Kef-type K+ transport system membrane component KefB